jgi:glucose-6-phosphate-specific signal transduction histidine kinase
VCAIVVSQLPFKCYFVTPIHPLLANIVEVPRLLFVAHSSRLVGWLSVTQRSVVHTLRKVNEALEKENAERRRAEPAQDDVAGRLINAEVREGRLIHLELDDHLSQTRGVLTLQDDQRRAGADTPPVIAVALDILGQETTDITNHAHRLSRRLHSSTLDDLGLMPALRNLVAELSDEAWVPPA